MNAKVMKQSCGEISRIRCKQKFSQDDMLAIGTRKVFH